MFQYSFGEMKFVASQCIKSLHRLAERSMDPNWNDNVDGECQMISALSEAALLQIEGANHFTFSTKVPSWPKRI